MHHLIYSVFGVLIILGFQVQLISGDSSEELPFALGDSSEELPYGISFLGVTTRRRSLFRNRYSGQHSSRMNGIKFVNPSRKFSIRMRPLVKRGDTESDSDESDNFKLRVRKIRNRLSRRNLIRPRSRGRRKYIKIPRWMFLRH